MEEVKIRLTCIEIATSGQTGLPGPAVREFSFLQLRMICELIALGCLVAHGDIKGAQTGKVAKEYSAQRIIEELEKLHPDFYPLPWDMTRAADGNFDAEDSNVDHFTKADLLSFYGKSGGLLHRGNVKRLLKPQMPVETHFNPIARLVNNIRNLLGVHRLKLLDNSFFICQLYGEHGRAAVLTTTPMQPGRGPVDNRGQI
jgi:hypothetical protein